jgi:DNA-binding IclR family transcriptional regulator
MPRAQPRSGSDATSNDLPVRSVARAVEVLLAVAEGLDAVGPISEEVSLSKATTHRLLAALSHRSMIVQDPVTGKYVLGPGGIRFADAAVRGAGGIGMIARPQLERLCLRTQETVALHVRIAQYRICIEEVPSPSPVRFTAGAGVAEPTYTGSAGKVLLAFIPEATRDALLAGIALRPLTDNTITSRHTLEEELARVAECGYAKSHGERVTGATGISAPVFGRDGALVAALSVLGPSERLPDETLERILPDLLACSTAITERLGAVNEDS